MTRPVYVYRGEALARYGFGDDHPFGVDRHGVFHDELAARDLGAAIHYAEPRRGSIEELRLFHSQEYIDHVARLSEAGVGFLDQGDTPV